MKKVNSSTELVSQLAPFKEKTIIDIGCGTGEMVRWLCSLGSQAIGIDLRQMIEKAKLVERSNCEEFLIAGGQALPFVDNSADHLFYIASFHHLPGEQMVSALNETLRVLKPEGQVVFVEPVAEKDSFYELTRLPHDEKEIQRLAYLTIQSAEKRGFKLLSEELFYFERTFSDFLKLVDLFYSEDERQLKILDEARKVHVEYANKAGEEFNTFTFKSICRRNIYQKV